MPRTDLRRLPRRQLITPSLRFAVGGPDKRAIMAFAHLRSAPPEQRPSFLASYAYLDAFNKLRPHIPIRDWVLDSGAFSAFKSGTPVVLDEYIACARDLLARDKTLVEIYALDVIGDWRASAKNTERMWAKGVKAIPCYHFGEPASVLLGLAKDYPKIALGGHASLRGWQRKVEWCSQCFARVWPKQIHGFGAGSPEFMKRLPFHSTDSTSWITRPTKFGSWVAYGRLSWYGGKQQIRVEVEAYMALEREAQAKWGAILKKAA